MKLTKPFDIERQKQFKKMVDVLLKGKVIRFYTKEIAEKTGDSKGNVSRYYHGDIPIGDKFWNAFQEAYGDELKKLARMNKAIKQTSQLENVTSPPELKQSEDIYRKRLEDLEDRISDIEKYLKKVDQKVDSLDQKFERIEQKLDGLQTRGTKK